MNCKVCSRKYNLLDRKPATIVACNHTACLRCMFVLKLKGAKCPQCKGNITKCQPNQPIMDILESLSSHDNLMNRKYSSANHEHLFEKNFKYKVF